MHIKPQIYTHKHTRTHTHTYLYTHTYTLFLVYIYISYFLFINNIYIDYNHIICVQYYLPRLRPFLFPFFSFFLTSSLFPQGSCNTPTGNHSPTPQPFKTATGHLLRRWAFNGAMAAFVVASPGEAKLGHLPSTGPITVKPQLPGGVRVGPLAQMAFWKGWFLAFFQGDGNKKKMIQL